MWLTCPISWPIGKLLDKLMGEHEIQRFDNDQLKNLILLHSKKALETLEHKPEDIEGLDNMQGRMIEGALTLKDSDCSQIMTGMEKVTCLNLDTVLDKKTITVIKKIGFSRIPITYNAESKLIVAILLTKSLIGYESSNERTIRDSFIK